MLINEPEKHVKKQHRKLCRCVNMELAPVLLSRLCIFSSIYKTVALLLVVALPPSPCSHFHSPSSIAPAAETNADYWPAAQYAHKLPRRASKSNPRRPSPASA